MRRLMRSTIETSPDTYNSQSYYHRRPPQKVKLEVSLTGLLWSFLAILGGFILPVSFLERSRSAASGSGEFVNGAIINPSSIDLPSIALGLGWLMIIISGAIFIFLSVHLLKPQPALSNQESFQRRQRFS